MAPSPTLFPPCYRERKCPFHLFFVELSDISVHFNRISQSGSYPISPLIYGVNFPPDASYIKNLGVTVARWGGNAVTAYNPFGDFTNAGADWYFENRDNGQSADDWLEMVQGAGASGLMTVPA